LKPLPLFPPPLTPATGRAADVESFRQERQGWLEEVRPAELVRVETPYGEVSGCSFGLGRCRRNREIQRLKG